MNIYIGNLSSDVNEQDLRNLFAEFGNIISAKIVKDMYTGVSKGFGFIEMPVEADAQKAIKFLNTKNVKGKKITVNEAHSNNGRRASGSSQRGYRSTYLSRGNDNNRW